MGADGYGVESTTGTYNAGTSIADMKTEAETLTGQVRNAVDAVTIGDDPDSILLEGLEDFRHTANRTGGQLATDVGNLGTNTAQGASTVEQTQNETTSLQNGSGNPVNQVRNRPIAV